MFGIKNGILKTNDSYTETAKFSKIISPVLAEVGKNKVIISFRLFWMYYNLPYVHVGTQLLCTKYASTISIQSYLFIIRRREY